MYHMTINQQRRAGMDVNQCQSRMVYVEKLPDSSLLDITLVMQLDDPYTGLIMVFEEDLPRL